MKNFLSILIAFLFVSGGANAQSEDFESFKQRARSEFSAFREKAKSDYEDFRKKANEEYIRFMRQAWHDYNQIKGIDVPIEREKPIEPIILPLDVPAPKPLQAKPIVIGEIKPPVGNTPIEQPHPVSPVRQNPVAKDKQLKFSFMGTFVSVRAPETQLFHVRACNEDSFADAWSQLCQDDYINMLYDCLKIREELGLCDWAYLLFLDELSKAYCRNSLDEQRLLYAWLFCQSGYEIRLGISEEQHLEVLIASLFDIYRCSYYQIGDIKYYVLSSYEGKMRIFNHDFQNEQALSLLIEQEPRIDMQRSKERVLASAKYPDMRYTIFENENLMEFYSTYPTSVIGDNIMTRWALYAKAPICNGVMQELYPKLKRSLQGKSQWEQVDRLLNWVQTAFVYEYDDKVWGGDRAFFSDETLYYPFCDCEDRSILFSRLVRDLLGLKVALIYYPGHLATAVQFTDESVSGDSFTLQGRRFIVCDPTYINAPVGLSMPNLDTDQAQAIVLSD